ncbi:MAG: twin-arginine translocase TatA/TatE family subunit [Ktedonobacteraceae bacterium]
MLGLHMPELIIILVVALLIFGPKKLPEMGSSIGKSIKEFRKGMNDLSNPKEEKEGPKKPDYDAIEHELASKRESYDFQQKPANVESEVVHTKDSKLD